MLRKLNSLLEAIRYPGGLRALRTARPRSLTSWLMVNRLRCLGLDFNAIIDGGANVGQFARAAHTCFPKASIFSFEPLPDIAEQLGSNLQDVPNFHIFQTALGAEDGEIDFYRHSYSQSSSARPMLHKEDGLLAGKSEEVERLKIPVSRLDTALADHSFPTPALLKLDVQGFELEALRGADAVLQQCDNVLLESVFDQQYEGEALLDEIWFYLHGKGYRFNQPVNFVRSGSGRIAQMDVLFSRADA